MSLRVDAGDEAVAGAVGDSERLGLGGEAGDGHDRAEHLLAGDAGFRRDLVEDGGGDELAARQVGRAGAAVDQAGVAAPWPR